MYCRLRSEHRLGIAYYTPRSDDRVKHVLIENLYFMKFLKISAFNISHRLSTSTLVVDPICKLLRLHKVISSDNQTQPRGLQVGR